MNILMNEIKFAVRQLIKQPTFSLITIGIMAIGIAGGAAIFSIYNELFYRPFPVPHSERLVDIDERAPKWNMEYIGVNPTNLYSWRELNTTFDCMAAYHTQGRNMTISQESVRVDALAVTDGFFEVTGYQPLVGRLLTSDDYNLNAPRVALLSEHMWRERFGREPSVVGQTISLDTEPYTIIGVLGYDAVFPKPSDVCLPITIDPTGNQGRWYLRGMGRLKADATLSMARDDLTRIHASLIDERPSNKITSPRLDMARDRFFGDAVPGMRLLGLAVGCVLLIACSNVSGIMLARSGYRAKELAIRSALGATRGTIIRQILTENLLLCTAGVTIGVLLGRWALQSFIIMLSDVISPWMTFTLDIRFILFCICLVLVTTLISGLIPALRCSNITVIQKSLRSSGRSGMMSSSHNRTLNFVVAGEIALACLCLVTAGLMIRTSNHMKNIDPGFTSDGILTYTISLAGTQYEWGEQRQAFFTNHIDRVSSLPGVKQAGIATQLPLRGHTGNAINIEGESLGPEEQNPIVLARAVSPGYFKTMQIELLAGRLFSEQDLGEESEEVVIVNESLVKRFWPQGDPVGKRIYLNGQKERMIRIVGVTRDVKHYGFDKDMRPGLYLPYAGWNRFRDMTVAVRCIGDPLALVPTIRDLVRQADTSLPIFEVRTMSDLVQRHDSMLLRCSCSLLLAIFAMIATLLASGGIYGVIVFVVGQRTQEMGIRMALGARPSQMTGHFLKRGAVLVFSGLSIGLLSSLALSRVLANFIFGISPTDWMTYASVSILLTTVTLLACYIPARKAAKIDPMEVLRHE